MSKKLGLKAFSDVESFKGCTKGLGACQRGKWDEAERIFSDTVAKYEDGPTMFYYGVVLFENGKHEQALEMFSKVENMVSDFSDAAKENVKRVSDFIIKQQEKG